MSVYPIVGAHFRPPAKAILQVLHLHCPLRLVKEPENPFDPNAIKVLWESTNLRPGLDHALDGVAQPFGFDSASILAEREWHLGYVPKTHTAEVHSILGADNQAAVQFSPLADGKPGFTFP